MRSVYSYIRFSSSKQADGDSLRRQTEDAQEWCEENKLVLDEALTYRDLGVSAYDKSNIRKGALALFIEAIKANKVPPGSILLVESLDRLSRAAVPDAISLLTEIVRADIEVITLLDGKRWTNESINDVTEFITSVVLFARAHEESKAKAKRIRKVYEKRRRNDEKIICNIGPGWLRKENGGWVPDDPKVESVRKVFALTLEGLGKVAIASRANKEAWPTPSMRKGKGWHPTLISRMLVNRAVLGEYHPSVGEPRTDFFPQVITPEQFNQVQAINAGRQQLPRRRDSQYKNVLQGVLHCGNCGARMLLKNKGRRYPESKREYSLYLCSNRTRGLTDCPTYSGAALLSRLLPPLFEHLRENVADESVIAAARDELLRAEDSVKNIKVRHKRLLDQIEDEDDPPAGIVSRIRSLETELSNSQDRLAVAAGRFESVSSDIDDDGIARATESALAALLGSAEDRERLRTMLLRYVKRVYLYPKEEGARVLLHNDKPTPSRIIVSPPGERPIRVETILGLPTRVIALTEDSAAICVELPLPPGAEDCLS